MGLLANRRSVMTLYSDPRCIYSHRIRIVLAEKEIVHEVVDVVAGDVPEELHELNPYEETPTLLDRDIALYGSQVIMEYLDERFPHPPLLAVDPVSRARTRLMLYRIERDWYSLVDTIVHKGEKAAAKARKDLRDSLVVLDDVFNQMPYFMSDEYTLADCSLAALLWRLPEYRVELPREAVALSAYCTRLFQRQGFRESLSSAERYIQTV